MTDKTKHKCVCTIVYSDGDTWRLWSNFNSEPLGWYDILHEIGTSKEIESGRKTVSLFLRDGNVLLQGDTIVKKAKAYVEVMKMSRERAEQETKDAYPEPSQLVESTAVIEGGR